MPMQSITGSLCANLARTLREPYAWLEAGLDLRALLVEGRVAIRAWTIENHSKFEIWAKPYADLTRNVKHQNSSETTVYPPQVDTNASQKLKIK